MFISISYTPEYGHDALKQGIDSLNYMHRFIDDRHRMVFHPNQPPKQYSKIPGIQKDKNYFTDPYPIYMPCSCNFLITIIKNQVFLLFFFSNQNSYSLRCVMSTRFRLFLINLDFL